jgi:fructokinase
MTVAERFTVGIELGGTKTIAVLGRDGGIVDRTVVPTTTPAETFGTLGGDLRRWHDRYRPVALGVASFGPIALDDRHGRRGRMLPNPKPGWSSADILTPLSAALPVPAMLHTDVTAAALAEGRWGAAQGLNDFVYVTIGTGIGMGIVTGGRPVSGRMHPEAGHIHVRRPAGDPFPGVCPFHGDCLEGLASGPAIAARAGRGGQELASDDPVWLPVADALAEAFAILLLTLSCERIVVGGGVGVGQPHLLDLVRGSIVAKLGRYLPGIDDATARQMIVPAALGGDAGPRGALLLADLAA